MAEAADDPADTPAPSPTASPARWWALAVLTALFTLHHVDRNLVSILAEPIKHEFRLSDSELGLLTGLLFAVSYAVAGVPVGLLVDRVDRTRLGAVALAIWSGLTLFSGVARSFAALALARIGVAAGESAASPVGMSLLTDYFPKHQRAGALGWFYASTPVGIALGYALGGLVAARFGWRDAFFFAGFPGIVLALLLLLTVREPKRGAFDPPATGPQPKSSVASVTRVIASSPALSALLVASMLSVTAQSGTTAFMAPFFIRTHHLPINQVGLMVGAALGVGGLLGMPLGGFVADRLGLRRPGRPSRWVALTTLAAAPLAAAGFLAASPQTAILLIGLHAALASIYYGSTFSSFMSHAPVSVRGSAGAFMIIALNLVGYGMGPQLCGLFSDGLRPLVGADSLRWALVAMTGFYVLAAGFFWTAGRALDRTGATDC